MTRRFAREAWSLVLVLFIAAAAAEFAHLFRELILGSVEFFYGGRNATESITSVDRILPAALIAAGILAARFLNNAAHAWQPGRLGIEAIANSAQGIPPGASLRGTLLRATGTLAACMPGTSLGRESAILESGGALGCYVGRRTGINGPALASAGVASAFAAAYHAPFGAVAYVGGHLGVWRDRRAIVYAMIGSLFSDWLSVTHLGGHPVFPGTSDSAGALVVLGAIAVVPAFIGARTFVQLRELLPTWTFGKEHPRVILSVAVAVSAAVVIWAPLTAGNGMEALRHVAVGGSIAAAVAMGVGKMIATSATLHAKAPGGVFSPTLAVAAGWVLATYVGLHAIGVDLPGTHWGGLIIGMSVGVAVGLHSPLMGAVVVAEMCGQIGLVPFTAVAAFIAHRLVHAANNFDAARRIHVPAAMHEEDA